MVLAAPLWALTGDINGDGSVDYVDRDLIGEVLLGAPGEEKDAALYDINEDGVIDVADMIALDFLPSIFVTSSPVHGEQDVAVTRETILRFSGPLDPATVTAAAIHADYAGSELPNRIVLSPDGRTVTLFYSPFLPGSSRIRVTIDGEILLDARGNKVDADADGAPGGVNLIEFDTLSLASHPGTSVCGRIFASELIPDPNNANATINAPLAGVRISVAGADSQIFAVTDALGNFRLENAPAGRFFVHIDGRTVTSAVVNGQTVQTQYPSGPYYPIVGKPWTSTPGEEINIGDIYLPLIGVGTLQPVSPTQETVIGFPPEVIAANPSLDGVSIHVPADSLYSDDGTRGGSVGIAPVAADRIPSALPDGLEFPIVITVQTDGASNFDRPVPVCFPNLPDPVSGQPLQPGEKSALWSFNHDAGRWEIRGSMTVSDDGTLICTDPGVGITYPGWHGSRQGTAGYGGPILGPASGSSAEPGPKHPPSACPNTGPCPEDKSEEQGADPIYYFSGEFYLSEQDLKIPGRGFDFVWSRKYRSKSTQITEQGYGWDYAYNVLIREEGADLALSDGNSRDDVYRLQTDGTWTRGEFFRVIRKEADETYTLVFEDNGMWVFNRLDGTPSAGRLSRIVDRNGNAMSLAYDGSGRLVKVTDTLGRDITLAYNAQGFIQSVTDFIGRSVRYEYFQNGDAGGSAGDLKAVISPAVTGAPAGGNYPNGKRVSYTYSKGNADERLNHNLLTITDGRRNESTDPTFGSGPYVINVYASTTDPADINFDRVMTQTWGDAGDIIDLVYLPLQPTEENLFAATQTIINDRMGHVMEYFYDRSNRCVIERRYTGLADPDMPTTASDNRPGAPLRAGDPPYFETRHEWTADSLEKRTIRPNGNITEYVYESEINPSAPRQAAGNVRIVRRLPGTHTPAGDQQKIEDAYEYDNGLGTGGCCGFNFVTKKTDGRGNVTLYEYDTRGNRTKITYAVTGVVEEFQYNSFGQMTRHIHPDNGFGVRREDDYIYNTTGPATGYLARKVADARGLALTSVFTSDAVGNLVSVTDPRGRDTQFVVNQLNQIVRRTSPETEPGSGVRYVTEFIHDANNNIKRINTLNVDDQGVTQANSQFSVLIDFEKLNYPTRRSVERDASHQVVTEYMYDANRNLAKIRHGQAVSGAQSANTETLVHDERDMLYLWTLAEGADERSTTQFDYDANGNLIRKTSALEGSPHVELMQYDGFDRRVGVTDPMGNVAQTSYDAASNPVRHQVFGELEDQPGATSNVRLFENAITWDPMNRVLQIAREHFDSRTQAAIGDGKSTLSYTHTPASELRRVVNDRGQALNVTYDTMIRPVLYADAVGNRTSITYDANSNIITTSEIEVNDSGAPAQTFTTNFVFDGLNRNTRVTDNGGNIVRLGYDSRGNQTLMIDPMGNVVRHEYDGLNRLTAVTRNLTSSGDGSGTLTGTIRVTQAWDDSSRLISQADDRGNITSRQYDPIGRMTAMINPDGTAFHYEFDHHGAVSAWIDPNGTRVELTRDELDRIIGKTIEPAPGVSSETLAQSFLYDGLSRLTLAMDEDSIVDYEHDSLSNVLKEIQNGESVVSTFDGEGNALSLTYPGGRSLTMTYDILDRLKTVNQSASPIVTYGYAGPHRLESIDHSNSVGTRFTYDTSRRVTGVSHFRNPGPGQVALDSRLYEWNASYRKTRVEATQLGLFRSHDYDSVYRLTQSDLTVGAAAPISSAYAYDDIGNRTTVTGGPGAGNYTLDATEAEPADRQMNQYTTTPGGARTYDKNGNLISADNGARTFVYDYRNLLVQANGPGGTVTYRYDPLGRRIGRTGASGETRHFYNGWNEIEEQDGSGATLATYVFGSMMDQPVEMRRGATSTHLFADDQNNVVLAANSSGNAVERYDYDEFGAVYLMNGSGAAIGSSTIGNPWMFQGRRFDPQTGLHDFRTRWLEPATGRFTTRDWIGAWGDEHNMGNAFAFVGNDPLNLSDPFGLDAYVTVSEGGASSSAPIKGIGHVGIAVAIRKPNCCPSEKDSSGCCPIIGYRQYDYYLRSFKQDRGWRMAVNVTAAIIFSGQGLTTSTNQRTPPTSGEGSSVVRIPTTCGQDAKMQAFAENMVKNPGRYHLAGQACVGFVQDVLKAGGLEGKGLMGGALDHITTWTPQGFLDELKAEGLRNPEIPPTPWRPPFPAPAPLVNAVNYLQNSWLGNLVDDLAHSSPF